MTRKDLYSQEQVYQLIADRVSEPSEIVLKTTNDFLREPANDWESGDLMDLVESIDFFIAELPLNFAE